MPTITSPVLPRQMLNKVPEATLIFWVIKILCTTVGETFADFLNVNLNFGLKKTSLLMFMLLVIALAFQFRARKYQPGVYWLVVVLISIVGTLITDYLTDKRGIPLQVTTVLFTAVLAVVFAVWYATERTLSIHTINTTRRECFYWLAILFTFALGTAAGDLFAETFDLGYLVSFLIFAALIGLVTVAHFVFRINGVLAFWLAYILTRPLGASLGDLLSQRHRHGGLGLGTTGTSVIFLVLILTAVIYLSITHTDATESQEHA